MEKSKNLMMAAALLTALTMLVAGKPEEASIRTAAMLPAGSGLKLIFWNI